MLQPKLDVTKAHPRCPEIVDLMDIARRDKGRECEVHSYPSHCGVSVREGVLVQFSHKEIAGHELGSSRPLPIYTFE